MRATILLSVTVIFFIVSCTAKVETTNIPEAVKKGFSAMYPEANVKEWKMVDGKYEASFHQNNKHLKVIMTEAGTILQYQEIIDSSRLPQAVKDYVSTQLGDQKITAATTCTDAKGFNSYEIEVDHRHYVFAKDGQFVGKRNGE